MKRPRGVERLQRVAQIIWNAKIQLQKVILVATCAMFTCVIMIQIVFRYFLFLPLHGMEELATYLAIWTYFIGGAYGAYERSHISASLVQMLVKNQAVSLLLKVLVSIVTVVVCAWMARWAFDYLAWSIRIGPRSLELHTPLYWVHASMFVGLALMSLYFTIELAGNLRSFIANLSRSCEKLPKERVVVWK